MTDTLMPAGALAESPGGRAQPLVSVSIVSHGHGSVLGPLLASLSRFETAADIELLITDNLGSDLSDLEPGPWHSAALFRNPRPLGFARNQNAALQRAQGKYICVLNPDTLLLQAVLLQLIRRVEAGEGDLVAPLIVDSLARVQDSFRPLPSPAELVRRRVGSSGILPAPAPGVLLHPDWIAGTFMLMRRDTFIRLGGFDDRFRLYFEDVDLCTRARLHGLVILVDPDLRLRHDPHRASRRLGPSLFWHVQGAVRFFTSAVYRDARALERRG